MGKKEKSTKVALSETTKEVSTSQQLSFEQIELIKNTVAKDATNDELKLFLYTAQRTGLDPLTRQIHFVKRAGRATIQTGIDGYRAIAERTGNLAGIDDAKYEIGETGAPVTATVTVYRFVKNTKVSFTASARWNEYVPPGGQSFMWQKMPYLMLGKVAEALALRKAFPLNLSGIYTNEEMDQAEDSKKNEVPTPDEEEQLGETESGIPTGGFSLTKKDKEQYTLRLKKSIYDSIKILVPDVEKEKVPQWIRNLTDLDVAEGNYEEIDARLALLVSEKETMEELKEEKYE